MRSLTPEEQKALSPQEAAAFCDEIRAFLLEKVTKTGGHLASNLGVVEISLALCRGLDLKKDRIFYDTGHQCYVHKILTGRAGDFDRLRTLGGLSGFPHREESVADPFGTGHSGTAVSAALGFCRAARLTGEEGVCAVVIGDGSFGGGMVLEALNNIEPHDRIIILLNDNEMSIGKSVGSLRRALNRMRTKQYYRFKGGVKNAILHLPCVGRPLARLGKRIKDSIKRSAVPQGNLFEQLGLNYFGPADGNDLATVEFLLSEAKKKDRPSLIHLCTKKGKGYEPAERDPARYHGISPQTADKDTGKSFSLLFGEALTRLAEKNERIVTITAAMEDGVGLKEFGKRWPERFFDVGIAEEHAMTFACGLAAAGLRPYFAVYSTFFQRAYDQFLHDAALQKLPVTLCLDRAGFSGEDGATHHGLFDLTLTLPLPHVTVLAPATAGEMTRALFLAAEQTEGPVVIRYPKGAPLPLTEQYFPCEQDVETCSFGEGEPRLQLITFSRTTEETLRAARRLAEEGIPCRVVRFFRLSALPEEALRRALCPETPYLFVEEGIAEGGFSQHTLTRCSRIGAPLTAKGQILAVQNRFLPCGTIPQLMQLAGLDENTIVKEGRRLVSP